MSKHVKTIRFNYLHIACHVGFRCMAPGLLYSHIIFVMLTAPLISNLSPNSKGGKCHLDHWEFVYAFKINIPPVYDF